MFLMGNKLCICFSAKTGVLVVTGEHSPHRKNTVSALFISSVCSWCSIVLQKGIVEQELHLCNS